MVSLIVMGSGTGVDSGTGDFRKWYWLWARFVEHDGIQFRINLAASLEYGLDSKFETASETGAELGIGQTYHPCHSLRKPAASLSRDVSSLLPSSDRSSTSRSAEMPL